jgi:endonuclease/exonuclease/phosphatase family metal-dependent hydrolase
VRLRVLVYNVHGFKAGVDRVANVVARFEPDLMFVNETGGRHRLRRFARQLGMQAAGDPWAPLRRRVKDAVLVRPPWRLRAHRLVRFEPTRWFLPRGALVAEAQRDGFSCIAIATHLGLRPVERIQHARALLALVDRAERPVLVGGDLNEQPDGKAFAMVADRLSDTWRLGGHAGGDTFPAADPTARIDALFVSEGVRVERALVPGDDAVRSASDHLPVVVQLALPEPG